MIACYALALPTFSTASLSKKHAAQHTRRTTAWPTAAARFAATGAQRAPAAALSSAPARKTPTRAAPTAQRALLFTATKKPKNYRYRKRASSISSILSVYNESGWQTKWRNVGVVMASCLKMSINGNNDDDGNEGKMKKAIINGGEW